MKNHQDSLESIQRNLLTYLAGHPSRLKQQGNSYAGDLALDLGNALVWICGELDKGPFVFQPVEETAQSVHALGKQFQEVGRRLLDLTKFYLSELRKRVEAGEKFSEFEWGGCGCGGAK